MSEKEYIPINREDTADIVEIEIHPFKLQFHHQTYPDPTREIILNAAREYLEQTYFSYSEKRITHNEEINTVNKELISSKLETFEDLNDAFSVHNELVTGSIGRDSDEQGGDREGKSYSKERDPFNE